MSVEPAHVHNNHLFQYPHKEGIWKEFGIIIGSDHDKYPKLFYNEGTAIYSDWKNDE